MLLVSLVYVTSQNSKILYLFSMTSSFIIFKSLLLQDVSVCFKSVFVHVCAVKEGRERLIHCKMHRKWKWKWIFIISRIVKDSQIWICNQHIIYIIFIWVLSLQEVQEPLQTLILLLLEDPSSSIIWWTADPVISQCLAGSGEQVLPRNLNSKKKKKKESKFHCDLGRAEISAIAFSLLDCYIFS